MKKRIACPKCGTPVDGEILEIGIDSVQRQDVALVARDFKGVCPADGAFVLHQRGHHSTQLAARMRQAFGRYREKLKVTLSAEEWERFSGVLDGHLNPTNEGLRHWTALRRKP